MTLAKGDHVLKLDDEGQPLTTERQTYVEFEVEELTPHFSHGRILPAGADDPQTYVVVLLRKVR